MVKNPPAHARDIRDVGSIPGSERSSGEGIGRQPTPACLPGESHEQRRAWWATVHGVTKSQTRLSDFHSLTHSLWAQNLSKLPGSFYLQLELQATMLQKTSIHFRYLPISLTQRFSKCSSWKFLIYLCSQNYYYNTKKITFLL